MADARRGSWRTALILTPPALSAILASVDPALLLAGAAVAVLSAFGAPVVQAAGLGLAIGALSGPGLELPVAWIALALAGGLAEGWRRVAAVPALVGLVVSLVWGMDPGMWPVAAGLAALSAGIAGADGAGMVAPVLFAVVGFGALRTGRVEQLRQELPAQELPAMTDRFGAAWMAPQVEEALEEAGWIDPEMSRRDRARLLAELGDARLALRSLGFEPLPSWERAALLNQAGRIVPARLLGWAEAPRDAAAGPGDVYLRTNWIEADKVVVPIALSQAVSELTIEAHGQFLLGAPELVVQVGGYRLGPVEVPDEGRVWTVPVALGPGVHRMTIAFENPRRNEWTVRAITDLRVALH